MPITQIRQYLTQTVLPIGAGAAANWLVVHLHFLAAFHVSSDTVAAQLTQLGVFGIGAGLAFLAGHHILAGKYGPTATAPVVPLLATPVSAAELAAMQAHLARARSAVAPPPPVPVIPAPPLPPVVPPAV